MKRQPSPFLALCRLIDTATTPRKFIAVIDKLTAKINQVAKEGK